VLEWAMAASPTAALRDALDSLRVAEPEPPTLWDRVAHRQDAPLPETPQLLALDAELAGAGVHTLADARLLGRLARKVPDAERLATGLHKRTRRSIAELELLLEALARQKRLTGTASATAMARAEDRLVRLERALAIAQAMAAPDARARGDDAPLPSPSPVRSPPRAASLATVERYVERAQSNALDVRRKRRDLDLAHELLLSLAASLAPEDRARAQALRSQLANARQRLDALEPLVGPGERIPEAISRALSQGRASEAYRGLLALHRDALGAGDAAVASSSREALGHLWDGLGEAPEAALKSDALRNLQARLGEGALRQVLDETARQERDVLLETALELSPEQFSLFDLALSAGEFFDTNTAEDIEEGDPASASPPAPLRRVPFPTPLVDFDIARGIHELRDFVIRDPRLVLYDLANGSQLVRAYHEPPEDRPKKTRRSAVRVYVCDASGSMRGARARFRDALLIAELNNLSLRARAGKEVWPIYYAFFNDAPTPLRRIDSPHQAYALIAELFERSPARGRTDITFALLSAFEAIHEARGRDPDLARATVVLVTDGEDQVDLPRISAARAPVGDVEVTLNFISLGDENEDLRRLVLQQRERGRRAFYSHLGDEDIAAGATVQAGLRTLLPEHPELALTAESPEVRAALEALAAIALEKPASRGPRASSRFAAYFPAALEPRDASRDSSRVLDLLAAVAEALALCPADDRPDEAVELLEHLLALYQLPVKRYREALGDTRALRQTLSRIRLLAGFGPLAEPAAVARPA